LESKIAKKKPLDVEIPDSHSRDVFLIEPGGLSPVSYRRVPGGIRVRLAPDTQHVNFLLTDRSGVIQQFNRYLRQIGPRAIALLMETAREELVDLDRRLEHSSVSDTTKMQLRKELHDLNSHVAPWMEFSKRQVVSYRQLEDLLWRLESLQRRVCE